MQSVKYVDVQLGAPPQVAFGALLGVVQNGGYTLVALSNERGRMLFASGKSALSWGQQYVADVLPAGHGASRLALACGGVDGAPQALLDGWKNQRAAGKLIAAVESALAGTTAVPVQPTASFRTAGDGTRQPWDGGDLPA